MSRLGAFLSLSLRSCCGVREVTGTYKCEGHGPGTQQALGRGQNTFQPVPGWLQLLSPLGSLPRRQPEALRGDQRRGSAVRRTGCGCVWSSCVASCPSKLSPSFVLSPRPMRPDRAAASGIFQRMRIIFVHNEQRAWEGLRFSPTPGCDPVSPGCLNQRWGAGLCLQPGTAP